MKGNFVKGTHFFLSNYTRTKHSRNLKFHDIKFQTLRKGVEISKPKIEDTILDSNTS